MKKQKVTIYDIAKKLDLTAATVSRALNNNNRISSKTRALVQKTALEMNYQQNKLAKALKSGRSNNVAIIVPYINRNFFAAVIQSIQVDLDPKGYQVIICQTQDSQQKEIEIIDTLINAQVAGIIMSISKTTKTKEHFEKLIANKIPLVFFDRRFEIDGVSSVTIDDFKGAYQATQHLVDQGCKRIAHLSGSKDYLEIYQNRFRGFTQAMEDNNLEVKPEYTMEILSDIDEGFKAAKKLFSLATPPDAVFASSDYVALGVMQYLRSVGIPVPEQVKLVGFSNEPFTRFMELSISSIDQAPEEMGRIAASVLLEQIENTTEITIEKKVVIPTTLYVRKSSAKNPD